MAEFKLPDLGEGVTEGEVVEWRVAAGDQVRRDQVLVVVGTDKATVEIPSPFEGTVEAILAPEGAIVRVGEGLVRVSSESAAEAGAPAEAPPVTETLAAPPPGATEQDPVAPRTRVPALPSVRRAARERGLKLESVSPSGDHGRVGMADLAGGGTRVPLRGARRVMAERMSEAHRRVPQVTVVLDCDVAPLEALLAAAYDPSTSSSRYSVLGLVALASIAGLMAEPIFNASFDEGRMEVVYRDSVDLGIAVQADDGLKVATLRGSEQLTPSALLMELARLVAAARSGGLSGAELAGSSFTISSAGRLGGLFATPLVNWPNLATLGIHQIEDRPVVRMGRVEVGRCLNLSLSFDHRVIDGMTASQFLYHLRDRLQAPEQLVD